MQEPLLAAERQRKRDELLALTEADLDKIQARVRREHPPLHGAAAIGPGGRRVIDKRKMAKHFELIITDTGFSFTRKTDEDRRGRPVRWLLRVAGHQPAG